MLDDNPNERQEKQKGVSLFFLVVNFVHYYIVYCYVVRIMALNDTNLPFFSYGENGYMNRIRNFHFKFTSVVGTKKTKLRISLYFEDV